MEKDGLAEDLKIISEITIEALKDIASKGVELKAEALLAELGSRDEIKKLYEERSNAAKEMDNLKSQFEKSRSKSSSLLKKMNELESEQSDKESFYRQALLTISRLARIEKKSPLYKKLNDLKKSLQEESDTDRLEDLMRNLKDAALRDHTGESDATEQTVDSPADRRPASFLSRLFNLEKSPDIKHPRQSADLNPLKSACQDILNDLRMHLGKNYLEALSEINRRIAKSTSVLNLISAKNDILKLIKNFSENVNVEREKTALFVKEITERIFEFEKNIFDSIAHADRILKADEDFSTQLKENIDGLKQSVNFTQNLEDLKNAVISRLDTINNAIDIKTRNDRKAREESEKHLSLVHEDLDKMKEKILSAGERSRKLEEELQKDPLTGAFNRRAYDRQILQEFNRYERYGTVFSMILFDVDHFKNINDQYGHAVGDKCLKEIIKRIKPLLRESDFLARYGGEEFIVLLPETERSSAKTAAEKIRSVVEKIEFMHRGKVVKITISLGVTEAFPGDNSHEEIFGRIDQAMYDAKNNGRNRVETR